ncbi:MAG: ATP-binding protein [Labedaea sp.]
MTFAVGILAGGPGLTAVANLWHSIFPPDDQPLCEHEFGYLYQCGPPYDGLGRTVAVAALIVGITLTVLLFRRVARLVLRPVAGMADTVWHMGPHNLGERIRWFGGADELRELANAMDDMLDRVASGFEGQRRFAANASHELRTPLAVQRTLLEVAMTTSNGTNADLNRLGAQLLLVNERNERLIEGLLALAESDRGLVGEVPVRLDRLVEAALDSYAELAAEHDVTLRRGLTERTVNGDPVLLERLVTNLLHNAIRYNTADGWVEIVVADRPALAVRNAGPHVPTESIPALFEPFRRLGADRTTQRDGAGLGLSIARSIVTAHRGQIQATPGPEGGLDVTVTLP